MWDISLTRSLIWIIQKRWSQRAPIRGGYYLSNETADWRKIREKYITSQRVVYWLGVAFAPASLCAKRNRAKAKRLINLFEVIEITLNV